MARRVKPRISKVGGVHHLMTTLERQKGRYAGGIQHGRRKAAEFLLGEAQRFVPIDSGELSNSGKVVERGVGVKGPTFVQFTAEHAIFVHEDMEKAHGALFNIKYAQDILTGKTHARRPQEMAKFLEVPARKHEGTMFRIIARFAKMRL